jgi:hypothetical protein
MLIKIESAGGDYFINPDRIAWIKGHTIHFVSEDYIKITPEQMEKLLKIMNDFGRVSDE